MKAFSAVQAVERRDLRGVGGLRASLELFGILRNVALALHLSTVRSSRWTCLIEGTAV